MSTTASSSVKGSTVDNGLAMRLTNSLRSYQPSCSLFNKSAFNLLINATLGRIREAGVRMVIVIVMLVIVEVIVVVVAVHRSIL